MAGKCYLDDIKDFKFTQDEISDIWKYAKDAYIDRGEKFENTISGIATDLGLKPEWIAKALTEPKVIRPITNQMYAKMAERRKTIQNAKDYVRGIDTPLLKKVWNTIYNTPFAVAVGFHGTVGMQTHAGASLFKPSTWNTYFPNFINQFKYSVRPAIHEAAMQDLVRRPNYITAKRAGLANDPSQTYTDYGLYAKWIPKMLGREMGKRGFDVLKAYRQDAFDYEWSKVPADVKSDPATAKEYATRISEMVNHSTGVIGKNERGWLAQAARAANPLAFAAKLEASRWARIIGDPVKTVDTFVNWKNASAADRHIALRRLRNASEFLAFYYTTLLANNAFLQATGSKDRVNFTDPSKSDWLSHKIAGRPVFLEGRLLAPVRLLAQLVQSTWFPKDYEKRDQPFIRDVKDLGQYARGKLAPFPSELVDLITGRDYTGRPLPTSTETVKGKEPVGWTEYLLSRGPIPLAGGTREIYTDLRNNGMSALQVTDLLKGLAITASELTGAKVGAEQQPPKPSGRSRRTTRLGFSTKEPKTVQ